MNEKDWNASTFLQNTLPCEGTILLHTKLHFDSGYHSLLSEGGSRFTIMTE